MAQEFYIKRKSTLPKLRMEVIKDGRHDFEKMYVMLQNSDVYFSMRNKDNGVYKILNKKAKVVQLNTDSCTEEYIIEYDWTEKDTDTIGIYEGEFTIKVDDSFVCNGQYGDKGIMKVPIQEELNITIL